MHLMSRLCQTTGTYIGFQVGNIAITRVTFRDRNRNNLGSYKGNLMIDLETMSQSLGMLRHRDVAIAQLQ
jgi:hypothetical protein